MTPWPPATASWPRRWLPQAGNLRARTMDLLIADTAHAHGARLHTRNSDDFVGFGDLVDVVAV
jgi:predicted nucleic acid-binding protein